MITTPQKILDQLDYRSPMKVADLGSGTGAYTLALAPRLAPRGQVYAIDVQVSLLDTIAKWARTEHVEGIVSAIQADIEKPIPLASGSLDGVILAHTLFQVSEKHHLFAEIARILRPDGTLVVVDWLGNFSGLGPHRDHVVSEHDVIKLATAHHLRESERLVTGQYEYGIIFRRQILS